MDTKGNAITVVNLLQEWTSKLPIHLAAYSAKDLLEQMTAEDIRNFVGQYFEDAHSIDITFLPK